ncbi:MAG: AAA family ATPase [Polyangiaceae bacterium]|nr:AAA family ATPase [Polyangiaceae bacterium]
MAAPPLALDGGESSFVGHEEHLACLTHAITEGRSLAIIGPPGVGKTRLVSEALRRAQTTLLVVGLSGVREAPELVARVAAALGITGTTGTSAEALARVERELSHTTRMLVLDGCESLCAEADELITHWFEASPTPFILTSRRRTGAPCEQLELPPLGVEASIDANVADAWSEAAELLRVRTLELARIRLGGDEREAVERLVRSLGGLPQAIELAAPRLGVLLPGQLHARIEHLRRDTDHDLDASIATSFDLLEGDGQSCLLACAAFPGGTDLEGLEQVVAPEVDAISGLMAARNHSLLMVTRQPGHLRYVLSRSVRDWLVAHARSVGTWHVIEARHANYWANRAATAVLETNASQDEAANLKAAFETCLLLDQHGAAEVALRLASPGYGLPYTAARDLLARVDISELPTLQRAKVRLKSGTFNRFLAEYRQAESDLEDARALALKAEDARIEVEALVGLGCNASAQSQWERSRALFAEAQVAGDDGSGHALTLAMVGNTHVNQDAWSVAEPLFRESISVAVQRADAFAEAFARLSLGVLLVERGAFDEAFGELVDAMGIIESGRSIRFMNSRHLTAVALSHIARVRQETGDSSRALVDFHRARRIADAEGAKRAEAFALCGLIGLLLELGEFRAAEDEIRVALPLIRENGRDYEGVMVTLRGVYYAMQGHQSDAERLFAHAAQLLERDRRKVFAAVLDVLRGHELPQGSELESFADVRLARRLRARFFVKPPEKPLLVAKDASFFRLSDQAHNVALGRRRAVRGVLRALVAARHAQPGVALSVDDLIRAGWPGERILPSAAAGRVYTAIATLRRMGLRGVVEQNGAGYLIPAEIPLLVHEDA